MKNNLTGSIIECIEEIVNMPEYEEDITGSFTPWGFWVDKSIPKDYFTYASPSNQLVKVVSGTELLLFDSYSFDEFNKEDLIECVMGVSYVRIPKKYIQKLGWH